MYTAFLFFVLLFFAVFVLISSTIQIMLKNNASKAINKVEKNIDKIIKKAKRKNIPITLVSIIFILIIVFVAGTILTYL